MTEKRKYKVVFQVYYEVERFVFATEDEKQELIEEARMDVCDDHPDSDCVQVDSCHDTGVVNNSI
jgi:hypothetical protein